MGVTQEHVVATVTRSKLYPTPGKNPRFAWKWIYDVAIPGREYDATCGTWSEVEGVCKSFERETGLKVTIAKAWEVPT